jgi:hypothetical protein
MSPVSYRLPNGEWIVLWDWIRSSFEGSAQRIPRSYLNVTVLNIHSWRLKWREVRSGLDAVCPLAPHRIVACLIESSFVTRFSKDVYRVRFTYKRHWQKFSLREGSFRYHCRRHGMGSIKLHLPCKKSVIHQISWHSEFSEMFLRNLPQKVKLILCLITEAYMWRGGKAPRILYPVQ